MRIIEIAHYSFRKLLREKVIFSFIFISFLLILVSILLGQMSFDEQMRILIHLGSTGMLFSLLGIALIYGSSVIRKEIDSQTILLTLARPISRTQYFLGQWLSLVLVIFLNWLILSVLIYVLTGFQLSTAHFFVAFSAQLLQIFVILSATMCFAQFVRPVISFFAGLGIYLVGQWSPEIIFFAQKNKNETFLAFGEVIHKGFPQLYRLNIQSHYFMTQGKIDDSILSSSLHCFGWILFFVICALFAFRRKDLV